LEGVKWEVWEVKIGRLGQTKMIKVVRVKGRLDEKALENALDELA
jgi:hypothetical protein